MNGSLLLGVITLVCIVDVFLGLRMMRTPAARIVPGTPPEELAAAAAQRRQTGRMILMATAFLWLIIAAMCFGVFPTHAVTPIKF